MLVLFILKSMLFNYKIFYNFNVYIRKDVRKIFNLILILNSYNIDLKLINLILILNSYNNLKNIFLFLNSDFSIIFYL